MACYVVSQPSFYTNSLNKTQKVGDAVDLSLLLQSLQEERAAVAMSIFLNRPPNVDNVQDLQALVSNGMDITKFTLAQVEKLILQYVALPL